MAQRGLRAKVVLIVALWRSLTERAPEGGQAWSPVTQVKHGGSKLTAMFMVRDYHDDDDDDDDDDDEDDSGWWMITERNIRMTMTIRKSSEEAEDDDDDDKGDKEDDNWHNDT